MPIASNRIQDHKVEEFVTNWLNTNYFSKIFQQYTMISNREEQLLGIDIIADGHKYDVKAQASRKYLNNPTETFSMEISFLRRGGENSLGWFINPNLKTEYYIFVWIPSCAHTEGNITSIFKAEAMIVDKKALLKGVANEYKKNKSDYSSIELASLMRKNNRKVEYVGNLKFVCSLQLYEKPVNIVLQKDWIRQFAVRHDIVTTGRITSIE